MKTKLLLALLFVLSISINAQIINDNFDSETIGSLPTGWVIKYNGTGAANQQVVNTTSVSPNNSFQLEGASSWSASLVKTPSIMPNKLSVEAFVKAEKTLSGQAGNFGLYNPNADTWGTSCYRVEFKNGKIIANYTGGNTYEIQSYNTNQWYHIKIKANLTTKLYQVYIDGVQVTGTYNSTTISDFPAHPTTVPTDVLLTAGNAGTTKMWFDDVKLYETPELVAHYPFNGNANDESGNANNGTAYGATLTIDRNGITNSAYYFDGVDDYILCNTEIGPFGTSSRTISFWAKTDVLPVINSQQNAVLSYGGNINTGGSRFEILLNPKCRGLAVDVSSKYIAKEFDNSDNNWHYYTIVMDNTVSTLLSGIKFYADGNQISNTCNTNGDISINTLDEQKLNIGRLFYTGQPRYFKGSIDEIRIYNKALTETEILNLFNNNTLKVEKIENIVLNDFYINNNTLYFKNTKNLTEITKVEVYNLLGQKVFKTLEIIEQIQLKIQQKGTYILKIYRNNNQINTGKFIIQ